MHFSKIKVTREYQYRGISTWLHAEVTMNEGEDALQAMLQSNNLCDESWMKISPEHNGSVVPAIIKEEPQSTEAKVIAGIYSCTEIKVLESYSIIARNKPSIQAAYDQQMKKLTEK